MPLLRHVDLISHWASLVVIAFFGGQTLAVRSLARFAKMIKKQANQTKSDNGTDSRNGKA
jgi:hypothetical protein